MRPIAKLTAEHEADLRRTYDEWLLVGRSTAPIDEAAARGVISQMYVRIGEHPPAVLFFSSPMMCILAYGALCSLTAAQSEKDTGMKGASQLESQLGSQLRSQLESQLESQLWSQLGSQLRSQLRSQLGSQLESQLESQLGSNYFAGQQWCAWEVFYDFCRRIGVKYSGDEDALLDLWLEQSRTCHWWWPYKGLVLASARPIVLHVDDAGRLHCDDGPALAYADGWSIYAWHGLRLENTDIITRPESITVDQIQQETNAEIRRVLLERHGTERFIRDSGAIPVHADTCGSLYRIELPDDEPLVLVKLLNGTPEAERGDGLIQAPDGSWRKQYWLRVPPTIKTARAAVAWTFGMRPTEYRPAIET